MRRHIFSIDGELGSAVRGDRLVQMAWSQVRPLPEDPSRVADVYRRRISPASGEADPPQQVATRSPDQLRDRPAKGRARRAPDVGYRSGLGRARPARKPRMVRVPVARRMRTAGVPRVSAIGC